MNSARDQEHYVTRRIPRTPTFCRLRPENAKCRSTSTRVCAGVSKRKATLKITATKRRGLVATRNCERSRSHYSAHGQPASIPLSSPRWRSSWPPEEKVESRRPRRRGAALMGSGRERINKRGRTQLDQPKRSTQTNKERKLKEPDHFRERNRNEKTLERQKLYASMKKNRSGNKLHMKTDAREALTRNGSGSMRYKAARRCRMSSASSAATISSACASEKPQTVIK